MKIRHIFKLIFMLISLCVIYVVESLVDSQNRQHIYLRHYNDWIYTFCNDDGRRGYADAEIEAVFAKYDADGDNGLNLNEQDRMQRDLDDQKVIALTVRWCSSFDAYSYKKIAGNHPSLRQINWKLKKNKLKHETITSAIQKTAKLFLAVFHCKFSCTHEQWLKTVIVRKGTPFSTSNLWHIASPTSDCYSARGRHAVTDRGPKPTYRSPVSNFTLNQCNAPEYVCLQLRDCVLELYVR